MIHTAFAMTVLARCRSIQIGRREDDFYIPYAVYVPVHAKYNDRPSIQHGLIKIDEVFYLMTMQNGVVESLRETATYTPALVRTFPYTDAYGTGLPCHLPTLPNNRWQSPYG